MKAKLQINNSGSQNSRLSWLGKERDKESGLGDHGVRKYDNISGRFLSIDPLWEKYLSWTPYQYAGNNPVNAYDVDGRDIIVLYDVEGANFIPFAPAGHLAVLIGPNEKGGWDYYSKDGTDQNLGAFGESKNEYFNFKDFAAFLNSTEDLHSRYDYGYRIKTKPSDDEKMKDASKKQIESYYSVTSDSCADTPSVALNSVSKASGTSTEYVRKNGDYYKKRYGNPIPHGRYNDIKKGNPEGEELDLNDLRNKRNK